MWIAKPLSALTSDERQRWISIRGKPLSQTLTWGSAIETIGGKVFVVMNTEEKVGGLVHSTIDPATGFCSDFECTNGPLLAWDDPRQSPRHLATFAMAVTKLSRGFSSLTLRPRWVDAEAEQRLAGLPIQMTASSSASTYIVRVEPTRQAQIARSTERMQRTLNAAEREGVTTSWQEPTPETLRAFAAGMAVFGREKGFFVPPLAWFEALVLQTQNEAGAENRADEGSQEPASEPIRFRIVESDLPGLKTRLLIAIHEGTAHFLFGFDERAPDSKRGLSTAASAHFRVLEECSREEVMAYDLNGYVDPEDASHPYAGVSEFKSQLGGEVLHYFCPEFAIS